MYSICLLVSGNLGFKTLKQIHESAYDLIAVMTDNKSSSIIEFCAKNGIAIFKGNPRNGSTSKFIGLLDIDVILSVNYLYIIEKDIINAANKYALNIHGSLLPKYRGRTPHVWAIINGEKETGITAHIINEGLDSGNIIEQIRIPIEVKETGGEILAKYNLTYPTIVNSVLKKIETNTLTFIKQDDNLATYFGKRTPADGLINWNWSKERIRNWIRAQADPYPGAFTYFESNKITIHKSKFGFLGFRQEDENGKILKINKENLIIKTPNGSIIISEFGGELPQDISEGKVLK